MLSNSATQIVCNIRLDFKVRHVIDGIKFCKNNRKFYSNIYCYRMMFTRCLHSWIFELIIISNFNRTVFQFIFIIIIIIYSINKNK